MAVQLEDGVAVPTPRGSSGAVAKSAQPLGDLLEANLGRDRSSSAAVPARRPEIIGPHLPLIFRPSSVINGGVITAADWSPLRYGQHRKRDWQADRLIKNAR